MTLRDCLADPVLKTYDYRDTSAQPAQGALSTIRVAIGRLLPPAGYRLRMSGSSFSLPRVPWVAVLDPDVTTTATAGIYVVYLFDASMTKVVLSLNQGATAHREYWSSSSDSRRVTANALDSLREEAAAIRGQLLLPTEEGLDDKISLDAPGFLPEAYEAGNIVSLLYSLEDLPDQLQLESDLARFLGFYSSAVEIKRSITASDPRTFVTPARGERAAVADGMGEFKPKDASDYVANVTAHEQIRTRKHEAVVKAYGAFAAGLGWAPSTKVHPRDLTLKRLEVEVLCEVKTVKANAELAVREAIGQLFAYRHFYYAEAHPPRMLAVFSSAIGGALVELLESLGIASVWAEGSATWAGSARAIEMGAV